MIEEHYFIELEANLTKKKQDRLTEYEKAVGFTSQTRIGSRYFNIYFGNFMHKIICDSSNFIRGNAGLDCENDIYGLQIKSRHDTMKQSMVIKELQPMIEYCYLNNKIFVLAVVTDKNCSRNIPLHQGFGLSQIKNCSYYNENKMRWISGDELYKLVWAEDGLKIKQYILSRLSQLNI